MINRHNNTNKMINLLRNIPYGISKSEQLNMTITLTPLLNIMIDTVVADVPQDFINVNNKYIYDMLSNLEKHFKHYKDIPVVKDPLKDGITGNTLAEIRHTFNSIPGIISVETGTRIKSDITFALNQFIASKVQGEPKDVAYDKCYKAYTTLTNIQSMF